MKVKNPAGHRRGRRVRLYTAFVSILVLLLVNSPVVWPREIRVGTWKTPQTIQPFFYEKFFTANEKVSVFSFTNPADQKVALLAGSLDMCGTTLAHAIHSVSMGQPVVVVAALCNKSSALVVRKGGPVKEVKDLKDRKIGYVPGTMHEILLRETLTRGGLLPDRDVQLTRVDFFDMGMALARGGIDAFLSGEPFPTLAVNQGYGVILSYPYYDESIGTINAAMMVKRKTLRENPGFVERLVRIHARATEYLRDNPEEWLKRASTFGTPLPILKQAAANMELAWHMDRSFLDKTAALGERMRALGLIEDRPNYHELIDLSFVNRITK